MSKIVTTNTLKGNPWNGSDMDKDRRMHNTKVTKGRSSAKRSSKRK
tara:strand:+ start:107 stop:244 length:138 start_codon:yes stop_codon:yes gene_type:complete